MIKYVEYVITWLFFMAIIVGLCLITPKLSKKIDKWREARRAKDNNDDLSQAPEGEQQPPETKE